jgi:hypothetical protein
MLMDFDDLHFEIWRFVGVEGMRSGSQPLFIYGAPRSQRKSELKKLAPKHHQPFICLKKPNCRNDTSYSASIRAYRLRRP